MLRGVNEPWWVIFLRHAVLAPRKLSKKRFPELSGSQNWGWFYITLCSRSQITLGAKTGNGNLRMVYRAKKPLCHSHLYLVSLSLLPLLGILPILWLPIWVQKMRNQTHVLMKSYHIRMTLPLIYSFESIHIYFPLSLMDCLCWHIVVVSFPFNMRIWVWEWIFHIRVTYPFFDCETMENIVTRSNLSSSKRSFVKTR